MPYIYNSRHRTTMTDTVKLSKKTFAFGICLSIFCTYCLWEIIKHQNIDDSRMVINTQQSTGDRNTTRRPRHYSRKRSKQHFRHYSRKRSKQHFKSTRPKSLTEITVVTAYFNLGGFQKGKSLYYTPDLYVKWMQVFGNLQNYLVVYTDTDEIRALFRKLRDNRLTNRTKIIKVQRKRLWAFSLADQIKSIYSQEDYPVHHPNTVNENYSCVMHAKYELVQKAIKRNYFSTEYFAWLDIGLFRDLENVEKPFGLSLPFDFFDTNKVAYSEVNNFKKWKTPRDVITENLVWISGSMFLGHINALTRLTQDYKKATLRLMQMNLMSTDQQILYCMSLENFSVHSPIKFQTYAPFFKSDYFYLGYVCKNSYDRRRRIRISIKRFSVT